MPVNITMPALSPTMEEGNLAKWMVKEGDTVASGDIIAEIETDKATMEVEAVDEGVIGKIVVSEGTEGVKVNAVIAVLLEDGESADDIGDTVTAAPAAANPIPAEQAPAPAVPVTPAPAASSSGGARIFASPLARRIAADKGIDLSQMKGTGPKGRIVKADVETFTSAAKAPAAAPTAEVVAAGALASGPSTDAVRKMYSDRDFEELPLDGMRKTIAARLTEAKQSICLLYTSPSPRDS